MIGEVPGSRRSINRKCVDPLILVPEDATLLICQRAGSPHLDAGLVALQRGSVRYPASRCGLRRWEQLRAYQSRTKRSIQPSLKRAVGGRIDAGVPQAWIRCVTRSRAFIVVLVGVCSGRRLPRDTPMEGEADVADCISLAGPATTIHSAAQTTAAYSGRSLHAHGITLFPMERATVQEWLRPSAKAGRPEHRPYQRSFAARPAVPATGPVCRSIHRGHRQAAP